MDRNLDKEYAGMMGFETFTREAYKLAFTEDQCFKDNMVRGGRSIDLYGTSPYIA